MSVAKYSLQNRSVVWFVLVMFLVGGVWSFEKMGKREDSTFVLKSAIVQCPYPGATPFEVERLVSEPLSRSIQSMRRIKKISAESYYGMSRIMVELESGTPADEIPQLWDELRRKATNAAVLLPEGAGPVVVDDDFSDVYGLYYALVADDGFTPMEMKIWADRLKTDILSIAGVQKVALYGVQNPVVNIYLSRSVLANFSISPQQIIDVMSQQNRVVDTGVVTAEEMSVRILEDGVYTTIEDIENQLLMAPDGRQFRLGDVARVERGYQTPPETIFRVDGRAAIGIGIAANEDEDVVRVGEQVQEHIANYRASIPIGLDIVPIYLEDDIAREANYSFLLNLLESVAIVILLIMLAMGMRSGVVIGSSLIFTIAGTMLIMYAMGEGINRTSLAGFIIAMGMLVDNAIVVVDNALKAMGRGASRFMALQESADDTRWSLLGATLIAILSFLPLYTAPSSVAEIIRPLFVVIALSLLLSWALAQSQVPIMGVSMLRPRDYTRDGGVRWFRRVVEVALRYRGLVVIVVCLLFVWSLHTMKTMPQNFFPQLDKNYFRADVILPEGYDIEATQQNLNRLTAWLSRQAEVARVSTTAGSSPLRYYLASGSSSPKANFGNVLVELIDSRFSAEVKRRFDSFVADSCPDVWLRSALFQLAPVADATIEIGFVGQNVDTLTMLAQQAEQIMWDTPAAINVRNSWGNRVPVWMPRYSQIKGPRIGVGRADMARWITLATQGYPMAQLREGDDIIPVVLKDEQGDEFNLSNLSSMPVFTPRGKVYPIEQASSGFDFDYRFAAVKQINRERVMKAQCDPAYGVNSIALLGNLLRRAEREIILPEGYRMELFGEQESQAESNAALLSQLPLAAIFIMVVLLVLFSSFREPIAILLLTPLIFIGVVAGLAIMNKSFDFFTLLGMIGLVGMNIKNAIILLSSITQMRQSGIGAYQAVVGAAAERVLPVCMASFTTILALIPLLFDSLFGGMAAAIMGGLLVATLLTLVVLPVVYSLLYGIKPSNK